jgi:DNA-binding winged helix-turn-helix (wHTH) protein/pimeloyl-ACP methyl ester carboxylesterase
MTTNAYLFGPFTLVPDEHLLLREDKAVTLTPKAFDTLCVLVERPGRLVTTQELLDRVWPDTFVEQNNLAQQVSALRRALADGHDAGRYIETVPRRGYRFVVPVTRQAVEAAADDTAAAEIATPATDPLPASSPDRDDPLAAAGFTRPTTRYALSGDTSIAYQVLGDGPIDIVFVMGWVSHLDYFWEEPSFARFLTRLAAFSRLILFDKRGTGLSDRVSELPTLEQRMDDVRAVMDAVGSPRAALLGVSEGGPMCSLFAATYPDKTLALVMIGTYAKRIHAADYPWAPTAAQREAFFDEIRQHWGEPIGIEDRAPSRQHDEAFRAWWATYLRMGASPGAALALTQMNAQIDVREVLPSIRVPTLILHRQGDRCLRVEEGRYVASRIPGARFVELPGEDHLPFVGDQDDIVHSIEAFLTGFHPGLENEQVLATVVSGRWQAAPDTVADVAPAAQAALERLQAFARREVEHFRGSALHVTADRIVAAFDGPARAIRCAVALALTARRLGERFRSGIDIGQCVLHQEGVTGQAADRAEALADLAESGAVLVSRAVHDLVAGAGLQFEATQVSPVDDSQAAPYRVDPRSVLMPGHLQG